VLLENGIPGRFLVAALPLAVSVAIAGVAGTAHGAEVGTTLAPRVVPGHILVSPKAGLSATDFESALMPHGAKILSRLGDLDVFVVQLPEHASEHATAALLARNPHFKFAEPDQIVAPDALPNDTYFGSEWHLQMVQAPAAWDYSLGSGITVAILDTGVNGAHPDLQGKMVPGWNFYDNNNNTSDVYGHGTKVAGVVAATSNNGSGVASVAWNAKLMPVRISAPDGYASFSTVASGINWAANNGARVANISYGVHGSSTVQSAAQYMKSKGGVVVNSAGNSGAFDASAASDAMISVSATNSADTRTSWSTWGAHVDLAAPGEGIWTTTSSGGYGSVSGTSFSSPLTAGVVALMMAANPSISPAQIESILKSTAVDRGTAGYDQYYGYGRVNAASAVQAVAQARVGDTQAPTAAITSPGGGTTVRGLAPVDVSAADNVGVSRVELLVNGALLATDTTSPYGFSWDTTKIADGNASLVARAYDAAGNATSSSAVSVTVANAVVATPGDTTPPTVGISSPGGGATVKGLVTVNASASDNVGVTRVELFVNGTLLASDLTSPYGFSWDTTKIADGGASLVARAYDAAGNATSSSTVKVTVANAVIATVADTTPPTVTITNPANGSKVGGFVTVDVASADAGGIANLTLSIDGSVKFTGNVASTSYKWNTKSAKRGTHTISAAATDRAGNRSTTTVQVTN